MALTKAQVEAIQRAQKKAVAQRAATQKTKISPEEARKASSTMNKRAGGSPSFTLKERSTLSKSELNTLGKTMKANDKQEKTIQKQRSFAKGEGKLPVKERVGTKAEYKQLGKEIQTRKQLIAYGKAARAAQAERKANPTPAKATPVKAATPVATKKTTASKPAAVKKTASVPKPKVTKAEVKNVEKQLKNLPKAPKMNKSEIKNFESFVDNLVSKQKPAKTTATVAPKVEKPKTAKPKAAKAAKPSMLGPEKVGTTAEYKALAAENKAKAELTKKAADIAKGKTISGKVTSKINTAKNAAKSSTAGKAAKAAKIASKPIIEAASKTKAAKVLKVGSKVAKVGAKGVGFLGKAGVAIGMGKEVAQIASGQTAKDFKRIQALENRVAVAKGQKPKYTTSGANRNLLESAKVDLGNLANIASLGVIGKSTKGRLAELKAMAKKAEGKKSANNKPAANKPSTNKNMSVVEKGGTGGYKASTSGTTSGSKYRVNAGDTLSGIAAKAGVSLKDLRAANPQITDPRKIYRNTGVVIPKSGKVPTGGYSKKAK
jgi:LysM repeat protein